jgi:nicotinate phosphoribosyltransferase
MADGQLLAPPPALEAIRARCAAEVAALPADVRRLRDAGSYPVRYSDRLVATQRALRAAVTATEIAGTGLADDRRDD